MRTVSGKTSGVSGREIRRLVTVRDLANEWQPDGRYLVPLESQSDVQYFQDLWTGGLTNLLPLFSTSTPVPADDLEPCVLGGHSLEPGDIVSITEGSKWIEVLFRESDVHHTVFLTNRCNSLCIMCSQPPTEHDDSWLVNEAVLIARLIRRSPDVIGFTGGEPLLLGDGLISVLAEFQACHPKTQFDVLTNGRLLSDQDYSQRLLESIEGRVTWMVPLYGPVDTAHDYIVQSPGAFEQTVDGLLTLHKYEQSIQLRVVLIKPVLDVLEQLCEYISRNFPFVTEVALMGCEPIGYARANRAECEVDIVQWSDKLVRSVAVLERTSIQVVLMNLPLCAIPPELHRLASRSISDWKQEYAPECSSCAAREACSGLFSWYQEGWKPAPISPKSMVSFEKV